MFILVKSGKQASELSAVDPPLVLFKKSLLVYSQVIPIRITFGSKRLKFNLFRSNFI
jgi:hypothetical protein